MQKPDAKPNVTLHNGHALVTVNAGEEWDTGNEVWCRLQKAVCQHCELAGPAARSIKGALQKFQRQHPFAPCAATEKPPSKQRKKK